jgi:hypothetical protein
LERVREEIDNLIAKPPMKDTQCKIGEFTVKVPTVDWVELRDQILRIKLGNRTLQEWIELHEEGKLLVKAENQDLPNPVKDIHIWRDYTPSMAYEEALRDMLKPDSKGEVWVKVLPSQE